MAAENSGKRGKDKKPRKKRERVAGNYENLVQPRFDEIEAWLRDGVNEKKIAAELGISFPAWQMYKKNREDLAELTKKTKDYVDLVEVVGAYKKRAIGYMVTERKREYAFLPDDNGVMIKTLVKETEQEKHVPGDVHAMENWLRLRQREIWGDMPLDAVKGGGVIIMPKRESLPEGEVNGNE